MRDPIDELEDFTMDGLGRDPLPAAEVRRRGTRMRRRQAALAAVGGIAAVGVIAAPILAVTAGSGPEEVQPAPAPAVSWLERVPEGFPLTDGMPETNGHDGSPVTAEPGFAQEVPGPCGTEPWTPERPVPAVDGRQAIYTGESEGGEARTLAVYADDRSAQEALDAIDEAVATCDPGSGGTVITASELPSDLGEESLVWMNAWGDRSGPTGDAHLHQVVRVGNALLLTSTFFGGAGDPAVVEATAADEAADAAGVIAAMCVFGAEPDCD